MIAREVPTSPKFRLASTGPTTEKKPDRFGFLLIVLGLGVFAGGASALVLTSLLFNQMLTVPGGTEGSILRISEKITDRQSAVYQNWEQVRGSLVLAVRPDSASSVSGESIAESVSEPDVLGTGLILTEDGWLVFPAAAISDEEDGVEVVLSDHRIFPIVEFIRDPLTQLKFARIEAERLAAAEFFPSEMIATGLEALVFAQTLEGRPQVSTAMLQYPTTAHSLVEGSRVFSSEQVSTQFLFATARKEKNGILTSLDGRVIGFVDLVDEKGLTVTPAFWIQPVLASLFRQHALPRVDLGVQWMNLERSPFLRVAAEHSLSAGALVTDISVSEKKIREGDVILEVNGQPLANFFDLNLAIQSLDPPASVEMTVLRKGERIPLQINLPAWTKK